MIEKNDVIGRFLVERRIDTGGMSEIFEVRDMSLNARWAMKAIDVSDSAKLNAAITETEILKSVSHPSIPRIADICEDNNRRFIFMDYIEGVNLKTMADSVGGFSEKDAVKIGVKLSLVLCYLHSKGIIYRDLKPSNVMITNEGYVRLTDFGIAAKKGEPDRHDSFYVTKEYAPPELLAGETGDERSDIYELGATLLYICKGKKSKGFRYFCKRCMRKKPDERFSDAKEASEFLRNISSHNKKAKKDFRAAVIWFSLGLAALAAFFFLFGMKAGAEGVILFPDGVCVHNEKNVYTDDVDFVLNLSEFDNIIEKKVTANGASISEIGENSYRLSGEGDFKICADISYADSDGNIKEEYFEKAIIVDKSPPLINISFSDRNNEDGSLASRTMFFSFTDLCTDYRSLEVKVNNERVDFEIPTAGTVDFTLDFEGVGSFEGTIGICDKVGRESIANIDRFVLGTGGGKESVSQEVETVESTSPGFEEQSEIIKNESTLEPYKEKSDITKDSTVEAFEEKPETKKDERKIEASEEKTEAKKDERKIENSKENDVKTQEDKSADAEKEKNETRREDRSEKSREEKAETMSKETTEAKTVGENGPEENFENEMFQQKNADAKSYEEMNETENGKLRPLEQRRVAKKILLALSTVFFACGAARLLKLAKK